MGLDRLVEALESARTALGWEDAPGARVALDEAFDLVTVWSSGLDPVNRPEVSAHLQRVCDFTLSCLDQARAGRATAIDAALTMLKPIRDAERRYVRETVADSDRFPAARRAQSAPARLSAGL